MTDKHTPGEWMVDSANPELVAVLSDGKFYEYIGNANPGDFSSTERTDSEIRANAKLFSAAPDMRKMLRKHEFGKDGKCPECGGWVGEGGHYKNCEWDKALKKARGKENE